MIHWLFTWFWRLTFGLRTNSYIVCSEALREKGPQMPTFRLWSCNLPSNTHRNTECHCRQYPPTYTCAHTTLQYQHVTRIEGPECFALFSHSKYSTLAIITPRQALRAPMLRKSITHCWNVLRHATLTCWLHFHTVATGDDCMNIPSVPSRKLDRIIKVCKCTYSRVTS